MSDLEERVERLEEELGIEPEVEMVYEDEWFEIERDYSHPQSPFTLHHTGSLEGFEKIRVTNGNDLHDKITELVEDGN